MRRVDPAAFIVPALCWAAQGAGSHAPSGLPPLAPVCPGARTGVGSCKGRRKERPGQQAGGLPQAAAPLDLFSPPEPDAALCIATSAGPPQARSFASARLSIPLRFIGPLRCWLCIFLFLGVSFLPVSSLFMACCQKNGVEAQAGFWDPGLGLQQEGVSTGGTLPFSVFCWSVCFCFSKQMVKIKTNR